MGIGPFNINYSDGINKRSINAMNNFLANIELSIVDEEKVGDMFILVFKDEIGVRETAHHAVMVDVAGASDAVYLKGVLLHLTASPITRLTTFRFGDKPQQHDDFSQVVYIGKSLPPDYVHPSKTTQWACSLIAIGNEIFNELTENQTNMIWSSSVNCQVFCKQFLRNFNFKWPTDLPCVDGDISPIIVDLSIYFISSRARKQRKKNSKQRNSNNTSDSE